jgi:Na+-transporting methylmalonyl-CoA/oxaloacetate decarboxylase gamma subunit
MNDALLITLIGGGMVFVGLILLWLMMALLVRLTSREKSAPAGSDQPAIEIEDENPDPECKQKAAAAAVGAILASMNTSFSSSSKEKETLSPWQNIHRNRQINQANTLSRRKND